MPCGKNVTVKPFRKRNIKFLALRLQSKISETFLFLVLFMMTFFSFQGCDVCKRLRIGASRVLTYLEFSSDECIYGFGSDLKVDAICLQNLQMMTYF